jgi:HrpA-like RNA helicase
VLHSLWSLIIIPVSGALRTLVLIGAFDDRKQLTLLGRQMSKFPLEPIHACAVLKSRTYGPVVTSAVVSIASILSSTSKVFQEPSDSALREQAMEARRKFIHPSGDHLTALNALTAYDEIARTEKKGGRRRWCKDNFLNERTCAEALNIRDQIRSLCAKLGIQLSGDNADAASSSAEVLEEGVLRSLTAGYAQNIALLQPDGTYKQFAGNSVSARSLPVQASLSRRLLQAVKVHPASALADKRVPAIIYDELVRASRRSSRLLRADQPKPDTY